MPINPYEKIKVNEVEVDFVALKLLIDGEWHDIEARQLNLLRLLVDNHGRAVSRNEIMDDIWHDTIVSDNSVSQAITQLRKSLHDDKETPRFIKTVPRVGYQLIAELEFPELSEPQEKIVKRNKRTNFLVGITSALGAVLITFSLLKLAEPNLTVPIYQYESRLTSTPGPENFLRYSPNGRYLAFSQISEDRLQMDLAIYDSQTQSVHTIKSTGYSEEAAEWSPDGKWLIYYRHDPISCEIRVMSVKNPIETWRISPDRHLFYCEPGYSKQKMHWLVDNSVYFQTLQEEIPVLTKLELAFDGYPSVSSTEVFNNVHPILMDIDKQNLQALLVEKSQLQFQLQLLDLTTMERTLIEQREQEYWGLKWHEPMDSFWLGNESLRLMSLDGHSEVVHLPMGFIPDLDLNPITKQLAHSEGLVNVNLYSFLLDEFVESKKLNSKQLSSAARTDILPTLSDDGIQTAFISYQRRSMDGLRHAEIWLKNKYKKTASLLVNLAENIKPQYLLWSPNGENLILGDSQYNLYLINIFSKHMVPIISNYQHVDEVNWSADGKNLLFSARSGERKQRWQYNLQLATTELLFEELLDSQKKLKASYEQIKLINPSYRQYLPLISDFLTHTLAEQLPVENLMGSLNIYRPHVFSQGIYYVVKQGNQLTLYVYLFEDNENIRIANIGNYEQEVHLKLNINSSLDGKQVVFSLLEGLETDILVQRKAE